MRISSYLRRCTGILIMLLLPLPALHAEPPQISDGTFDIANHYPEVYRVWHEFETDDGAIIGAGCTGVAISGGSILLSARHCFEAYDGRETRRIVLSNCPNAEQPSQQCESLEFERPLFFVAPQNGLTLRGLNGTRLRLHLMPRVSGKTRDMVALVLEGTSLPAATEIHAGDIFSEASREALKRTGALLMVGYGRHTDDWGGKKYAATLSQWQMGYTATGGSSELPWEAVGLIGTTYALIDLTGAPAEPLHGDGDEELPATGQLRSGDSGGPLYLRTERGRELIALATSEWYGIQAQFTLLAPSERDNDKDIITAQAWLADLQTAYKTQTVDAFVSNTVDTGALPQSKVCLLSATSAESTGLHLLFGGMILLAALWSMRASPLPCQH